jgi:hypothetical protein
MKQTLGIVVILGGLSLAGALTGCAGGGYGYYASTPPPPPVRVEARGVAPGAGFVWVDGYWGYRGGNYARAMGSPPADPRQVGSGTLGSEAGQVLLSRGPLALKRAGPRP